MNIFVFEMGEIRTIFKKALYREKKQHKLSCSRLGRCSSYYLEIEKTLFLFPTVLTKLTYNYIGEVTADDLILLMENLLSTSWYSTDENTLTLLQNEEENDYYVEIHSFRTMRHWRGGDVYPIFRHSQNKIEWLTKTANLILESKDQRLCISCFWADMILKKQAAIFLRKPIYLKNETNEFVVKAIYNQKKGMLIVDPLDVYRSTEM